MKNKHKVLIGALMAMLLLAGCSSSQPALEVKTQNTVEQLPEIKEKGTVVILATGGTIAGSGKEGKETNYTSGVLTAEELIESVPGIDQLANIEAIQVCNINSDDINMDIWCLLAETINKMAQDENINGFVITHGTDTLEETAYFLNLVIKTDKPVVITGSMRPSTSISADGPMNLYQSVCVAASEKSKGLGVLAVFSDHIFSARSVEKISTFDVRAVASGEIGCVGIVRNDEIFFYESSLKKHTINSEFSLEDIKKKPKVSIAYFSADTDADNLKYMAEHSDGLVIAGAGAGEFNQAYIDVINNLKIPVIISSRINDGVITQDAVLCKNSVAANNLSPQKAAILLKLSLEKTNDQNELIRIFGEY